MPEDEKLELWKRQYQREKQSRKEAEELLESKSRELYKANEELKNLTKALEERVAERTEVIKKQRNDAQLQAAQLLESENRFQDVIKAAGEYVWETDEYLILTYLSDQASTSLEYEIEDLIGSPLASIFANQTNDDQATINNLIDLFHKRKTFKGQVLRCRDKSENYKWHSISAVPKYSQDGEFHGFRGTGRDISDIQKARDEAIQAARAKSEFFSNMSHEIRTPLNGIVGMSQVMLDSDLREDQFGYAKTIKASADSLASLINSIFDISAIESGNLKFLDEEFSIDELIDNCIDYSSIESERKGIPIELEIDESVPLKAIGDQSRLKQAIANLLNNAIKFTNYGEVRIHVATEADSSKESLVFRITDTGIGISDTNMGTIFKSYEASHAISYQNQGGTGLGLAISKGIAEAMGGSLTARSVLDSGSTFTLRLPLQSTKNKTVPTHTKTCWIISDNDHHSAKLVSRLKRYGCSPTRYTPNSFPQQPRSSKIEDLIVFNIATKTYPEIEDPEFEHLLRFAKAGATVVHLGPHQNLSNPNRILYLDTPIRSYRLLRLLLNTPNTGTSSKGNQVPEFDGRRSLVIDDNSINLQVAKAMLARLGFSVETSLSAREGIDLLEQNEYDVILMDIRMPNMNGIEATRAIRTLKNQTPIIAVTANAREGEVDTFYQSGMSGYVPKPLLQPTLEKELRRCLFGEQKSEDQHETTEASSSTNIFEEEELLSIFTQNLELSQLVASEFSKQSALLMTDLLRILESKDARAARECLHNLSGSAYNLRANHFGESCTQLSRLISEGAAPEKIQIQLTNTRASYEKLLDRIDEFLAK